jgi:esterase/lipase superfamily enzyme
MFGLLLPILFPGAQV